VQAWFRRGFESRLPLNWTHSGGRTTMISRSLTWISEKMLAAKRALVRGGGVARIVVPVCATPPVPARCNPAHKYSGPHYLVSLTNTGPHTFEGTLFFILLWYVQGLVVTVIAVAYPT
jgi:hypothetical protein